jgi:hypothetical protein
MPEAPPPTTMALSWLTSPPLVLLKVLLQVLMERGELEHPPHG